MTLFRTLAAITVSVLIISLSEPFVSFLKKTLHGPIILCIFAPYYIIGNLL